MPLTAKGEEIMSEMKKEYGEEKGESVFYASKNAGTITGVDNSPCNVNRNAPEDCMEGVKNLLKGGLA